MDIMETKPSNAISIIETDCEVDFAPPLDYKELERPAVPTSSNAQSQVEEAPAEAEPKFSAFTGAGRRWDGKPPLKQQPPPVSSSVSKDKRPAVSNGNNRQLTSGASSQNTAGQAQGKLVFGSNVNRPKETKQEPGKQAKLEHPVKKEDPKFQPFTGRKYSLKG